MHLRSYLYLLAVLGLALVVFVCAWHVKDKLTRPSSKRTTLEIAFLLCILLLGITAILYKQIRGTKELTLAFRSSANDTYDQYIPYYLSMIRSLKHGALPLWNSSYGMGTSIIGNQSWSFDPFNLVLLPLCLVFGEGFLAQALAITFAARALASGLLFSHVLTYYCKTPLARIFGATCFGLGGYLFCEGQHFFFGTAWVLLALLLLVLEWFFDQQRSLAFVGVALVVAAFICFSVYLAFLSLLFIPLYVALRLIVLPQTFHAKTYLTHLGLSALAVFSGCLLAGIMFIPSAYFIVHETARISGVQSSTTARLTTMLASFLSPHAFMLLLSRFMGNGLISSGTNYHYLSLGGLNELEFFQGGLSCGVFILLGQFFSWLAGNASKREKLAVSLASLLIVFYCLNYTLPSLLTVFRYPTYRGCLLIDAVVICALSIALEKRLIERPPSLVPLVVSSALSLAVLFWSWKHSVNGKLLCMVYACLLFGLMVLMVARQLAANKVSTALSPATSALATHTTTHAAALALAAVALLISSVAADSFCALHFNPKIVPLNRFPLSYTQTGGNDTLEALAYLNSHDNSFYRSERTYTTWNSWNDAMSFGYRGISSYNSSEDGDLTRFYLQLWPEVIAKDAGNFYCYSFKLDTDNPQMMALTGIRYIISHKALTQSWAHELMRTSGGMYLYEVSYKQQTVAPLYVRTNALSDTEADKLDLAERRAILDDSLIVDKESFSKLALPQSNTNATATVEFHEAADGFLSGTVDATSDCLACLAVPNVADWIVRIDGKEVTTFKANYGFVGFKLTSGTHTIEAYHRPAQLAVGAGVSAVGLVLLIAGTHLTTCTRQLPRRQSAQHLRN